MGTTNSIVTGNTVVALSGREPQTACPEPVEGCLISSNRHHILPYPSHFRVTHCHVPHS